MGDVANAVTVTADVACDVVPQSRIAAPTVQYVKFPDGPDIFDFFLSRDSWPDVGHVVRATLDLSLDGGATWASDGDRQKPWPWGPYPISFGADGGDTIDPATKQIALGSGGKGFPLPDPKNTSRVLRVTITPDAAIDTKANLVASVKQ